MTDALAGLLAIEGRLAAVQPVDWETVFPSAQAVEIDQACDAYWELPEGEHLAWRQRLAPGRHVRSYLLDYASAQIAVWRDSGAPVALQRALAALSLEEARTDWRDTASCLGALIEAAEARHVTPYAEVVQAARAAAPPSRPGPITARRLLNDLALELTRRRSLPPRAV